MTEKPKTNDIGYTYDVIPKSPPNDGILFVDHSQAGRSRNLGHALHPVCPIGGVCSNTIARHVLCPALDSSPHLCARDGHGWGAVIGGTQRCPL
jgi:hypothetical protein